MIGQAPAASSSTRSTLKPGVLQSSASAALAKEAWSALTNSPARFFSDTEVKPLA